MPAVLGVLGGMGPLASARFLRTLYEVNGAGCELDMPRILLDSDPTLPDRTTAILAARAGRPDQLNRLGDLVATRLRGLLDAGADRIVVACFTAHHLLDRLAPTLRRPLVSLVDRAIDELADTPGRLLMLSTTGTRRARVFERAAGWRQVADRVVSPDGADQDLVHRLIYQLKRGGSGAEVVTAVDTLVRRHGCTGAVLGCTEFHLVSPDLVDRYGRAGVVDALLGIAEDLLRPATSTRLCGKG